MGGYNTVCELLSFRKRALVVPRVTPRREQLIRAERLSALGLLDLLHPDELTPGRLSDWLGQEAGPPALGGNRVDLGGLARVRDSVEQLLAYPAMVSDSAVQPVTST
jgi:predicted glycosyltransferase